MWDDNAHKRDIDRFFLPWTLQTQLLNYMRSDVTYYSFFLSFFSNHAEQCLQFSNLLTTTQSLPFFCKALIFLLRKFTKYVIYHQIVGFFKIHSMPLHFFLTTILSGLKYWVFFSSSIFFIRSPMLQHFLIFDSDLHFLLRDFRVHIF